MNWFSVGYENFCKLYILFDKNTLEIKVPTKHKVKIKIFSKTKFPNAVCVSFLKYTEPLILRNIILNAKIQTSIGCGLKYFIELEI